MCHWERNGVITLSCAGWVMTELLMKDNGVLHLNMLTAAAPGQEE